MNNDRDDFRKFENNRETIADHRNVLLPNFFFPLFWKTKRDQQPELSFSQHVSTRSKTLVLEHVETTNEKKKGVGKICWSNASLLPLVSFLAHDSRRGGSIQLATDLSRPFSSTRWKVGERVVPWMRGEPFWERGDGTSLDEKPARKKMVPKGRRKCGVKSGEGWSALNYESTGTTLGMGELSPE